METKEEFKERVLKPMKTQGLVISRIPKITRSEFVEFAEEHYSDDYGMLLVELWNRYKEYSNVLQGMDIKLNYLVEMTESKTNEEKEPVETAKTGIKMLDGIEIQGGGKK